MLTAKDMMNAGKRRETGHHDIAGDLHHEFDDTNPPVPGARRGKCPWCVGSQWHELKQPKWLWRDVYACLKCHKRTLPCKNPECENMAQGKKTGDEDVCNLHVASTS